MNKVKEAGMMEDLEAKKKPNTGQEANMSTTIRGFYKGYSVLLTMRDPKVSSLPLLEKSISAINWMEANEFKPSWDEPKQTKLPLKGGFDKTKQENCDHVGTPVVKEAGPKSKNPGRSYQACPKCGKWIRWADFK